MTDDANAKSPSRPEEPGEGALARLTALEMRHAEQERTIEELSGQIAAQWTVVDRLRAATEALAQRLLGLEAQAASEAPARKPPHY